MKVPRPDKSPTGWTNWFVAAVQLARLLIDLSDHTWWRL